MEGCDLLLKKFSHLSFVSFNPPRNQSGRNRVRGSLSIKLRLILAIARSGAVNRTRVSQSTNKENSALEELTEVWLAELDAEIEEWAKAELQQ